MGKDRFRYRVWNKKENKYDDYEYQFIGKSVTLADIYNEREYIIEMCTGLKDRNGKLIYEGDIVKYYVYDVDKFNPVLRVKYTELLMRFDLVSEDGQSTYLEPFFNKNLEVIGNIHER